MITLQWKQEHFNEQFIWESKLSWGLESQDSQEEQKEKKFTEEIQNKIKEMREIFLCLVSQVLWKTANQPSMDKQNERKDKKGLKEYKEDVENEIRILQYIFLCLLTWSFIIISLHFICHELQNISHDIYSHL